jgi:hypothetical protein
VAIAVKQVVDPAYLLREANWGPQGWHVVKRTVVKPVPGDAQGMPLIPIQLDAFEWIDVQAFGFGNTDDAMARLRREIQARGSDLYAYALLRREVVNVLGIHSWSYRLLILHSIVQLVEFAVLILAIAFAAIIFIQYLTTGHSLALDDLKGFWTGVIHEAGSAVGEAGGGIATPFIWATVFAGTIAIAFAVAGKGAGVKARTPSAPKASVGLRTGPLSTRING